VLPSGEILGSEPGATSRAPEPLFCATHTDGFDGLRSNTSVAWAAAGRMPAKTTATTTTIHLRFLLTPGNASRHAGKQKAPRLHYAKSQLFQEK